MIFSGLLWLEFDKYRLVGKRGQVDRTPDPLHRARSSIFYVLFLSFFCKFNLLSSSSSSCSSRNRSALNRKNFPLRCCAEFVLFSASPEEEKSATTGDKKKARNVSGNGSFMSVNPSLGRHEFHWSANECPTSSARFMGRSFVGRLASAHSDGQSARQLARIFAPRNQTVLLGRQWKRNASSARK